MPVDDADPSAPVESSWSLDALPKRLVEGLGREGLERLRLLAGLCPAAVQEDRGHWLLGCRVCPPFDGKGPDGRVVDTVPGSEDFYELRGLTQGSFSAPGKVEAALVFSGCEAALDNYGGTLLAARDAVGTWKARSYRSGLNPDECRALPIEPGRALLLCRWTYGHLGVGRHQLLVYDFARGSDEAPEQGWTTLFELLDDAQARCGFDTMTRAEDDEWISTGRIDAFEVELPKKGEPVRVKVDVHAVRRHPTAAYRHRCQQWQDELARANPRHLDVASTLKAPPLHLTFEWNGTALQPNVSTQRSLESLSSPEP